MGGTKGTSPKTDLRHLHVYMYGHVHSPAQTDLPIHIPSISLNLSLFLSLSRSHTPSQMLPFPPIATDMQRAVTRAAHCYWPSWTTASHLLSKAIRSKHPFLDPPIHSALHPNRMRFPLYQKATVTKHQVKFTLRSLASECVGWCQPMTYEQVASYWANLAPCLSGEDPDLQIIQVCSFYGNSQEPWKSRAEHPSSGKTLTFLLPVSSQKN